MLLRLLGNKVLSGILKYVSIALLFIFAFSLLIPLIWMIYTAFKPSMEYFENSFKLPRNWTFSNFLTVMPMLQVRILTDRGEVLFRAWDMLGISIIWAAGIAFVSLFFTLITAYVMAKYKFIGRNVIYMIGIFVMIVPVIGALPSQMVVKKALNIYDNMFMHIITSPGVCFSGMWFLLFYAAFQSVPWEYAEAAFIDGAGHYRVMFTIMLPLMIPTFAAIFLLSFLGTWNDYNTFILWLPSYANLAYGMYLFQLDASSYGASMPQIMAGFIICMIPTVIIYVASQKLITSKLMVGGLKG